jgi:hypothetical protein
MATTRSVSPKLIFTLHNTIIYIVYNLGHRPRVFENRVLRRIPGRKRSVVGKPEGKRPL